MELEKVFRLISDNKDINPDDFDILMSRSLFEAVVAVRDIVAKRGYGVIIGLVQPVPKTISGGCISWAMEFKSGEGTFNVYQVNVSVHVIDSGALSHKPELCVSLTKEDGTCLYSDSWNYPKDGVPCLKDIVLNAMDKAGIAWYGADMAKAAKMAQTASITKSPCDNVVWYFMAFWKQAGVNGAEPGKLYRIVRSTDYTEIDRDWREMSSSPYYDCTPITIAHTPDVNIEKEMLDKLGNEVKKDEDFFTLASMFSTLAKTVKIGNQEWMANNLRMDDGGEGVYHDKFTGEVYYTWEAANRIAGKIPGWRLPNGKDWTDLEYICGSDPGTQLKSASGWADNAKGIDKYGFNALPFGYYSQSIDRVRSFASSCYFWTADAKNKHTAYYVFLTSGGPLVDGSHLHCEFGSRDGHLSVRLIKETEINNGNN